MWVGDIYLGGRYRRVLCAVCCVLCTAYCVLYAGSQLAVLAAHAKEPLRPLSTHRTPLHFSSCIRTACKHRSGSPTHAQLHTTPSFSLSLTADTTMRAYSYLALRNA